MSDNELDLTQFDDEDDETFKSRCTVNLRPGGIPTRSKNGSDCNNDNYDSSQPPISDTILKMAEKIQRKFLPVPQLTSTNYNHWSRVCEASLKNAGCWIDPTKDIKKLKAEEAEINKAAANFIICHVDENNLAAMPRDECFITLWNKLNNLHTSSTTISVAEVYNTMVQLRPDENKHISHHLLAFEREFNKLRDIKKSPDEETKVALLLTSLRGTKYSAIADAAYWQKMENLTVADLTRTLTAVCTNQADNPEALASSSTRQMEPKHSAKTRLGGYNNDKWCNKCKRNTHNFSDCWTFNPKNRPNRHANTNSKQSQKGASSHVVGQADENDGATTSFAEALCTQTSSQSKLKTRNSNCRFNPFAAAASTGRNSLSKHLNTRSRFPLNHDFVHLQSNPTAQAQTSSTTTTILNSYTNESYDPKSNPLILFHENIIGAHEIHRIENCMISNAEIKKNNELRESCFNSSSDFIQNQFIIDSGASMHMTNNRNIITDYNKKINMFVTIADGTQIPIEGIGIGRMSIISNGVRHNLTLPNIAFVPKLSINLISVRMLIANGAKVIFEKNKCILIENSKSITIGTMKNSQFYLNNANINQEQASLCLHDWHKILAHKNIQDIKTLSSQGVTFTKCKCSDDCAACLEGKFTRLPFPKVAQKPLNVLDIIVSDVCGEMSPTIGGARYFITLIDVHSDYTEIYLMKHKSEATSIIINYIKRVENALNCSVKVFRSDRGGEFCNSELDNFLKSRGIRKELTVNNSPEQNGNAERKNRTLIEATRSMLAQHKLNKNLWGEALRHANYTFNRIPHRGSELSPVEKFSNKRIAHKFYEFGHKVFYSTNPAGRKKLDPRGVEGIFLGVDDQSKGFRILTKDNKVRIERNVRFVTLQNASGQDVTYESPHVITHSENNPKENEVQKTIETDELTNSSIINESQKERIDEPPRRSERLKLKQMAHVASDDPMYEPKTYKQAIKCKDSDKWIKAMLEEINSINASKTWTETTLPENRKAIGSRWVFKLKKNELGGIERYKARLVAQGFTQKFGIDYDEVFAPVTRSATVRTFFVMASLYQLKLRQADFTTAFLHGKLEEEIFMNPPPGHETPGKVFKLNKSLYGLKQSARVWNNTLHKALVSLHFQQSYYDECLYIMRNNADRCYIIVHVDDLLLAGTSDKIIDNVISGLNKSLDLKSLGEPKNYLGIQINKTANGSFELNQSQYIHQIAREFQLEDSKGSKYPIDPGYHKIIVSNDLESNNNYRKLIGMLLFVSTNTRPDISAAVNILAQRVSRPRELDMTEALRVVKYLLQTKENVLTLHKHDPQSVLHEKTPFGP